MIKIKFAEQLKKLGKNASEVALETGINRNTINALVNDKSEGIKFSTIEKLCRSYNLALTDILDYKAEEKFLARRKLYKQEVEMVPFIIWPGMIALSKINLSTGGKTQNFGRMNGFFKGKYTIAYWDYSSMNAFAKMFYHLNSKPKEINRYWHEYLVIASELASLFDSLYGVNPVGVSSEYFAEIVEIIKRGYVAFWLKCFVIETFDAGYDQEEIKKIAQKHGFDRKEIETLTTPVEMTFDNEQRLAFLDIVVKMIGKKGTVAEMVKKYGDEFEIYKQKFDYHKSNFAEAFHISDEEIVERCKRYLEDPKFAKSELRRLQGYSRERAEQIKAVLKKHHLKENPLYFFNKLTYFREHRKMINLKGVHVLDFILSYVEAKTGISKKYLKFLSLDEVGGALTGLVSGETLRRRYNEGTLVSINYNETTDIKIFEGTEAASIQEELEQEYLNAEADLQLIRGYTASQGFAKGAARIILKQEDFDKFSEGEILVTTMSRPDFTPLMKRAGAIVTNEGGITCHAAIIARELNKPCIIGTKIATKMIHDGDIIEVRANHGTVRILEKA